MSALPSHPQRHLVTAEEYLRMGEAGIFAPDDYIKAHPTPADVLLGDPGEAGYRFTRLMGKEERVECTALPEVWVSVGELFAWE